MRASSLLKHPGPRARLLVSTWIMTHLMEDGRAFRSRGSLSIIIAILSPGKQRLVVLKKHNFLVMESPTIKEVGGEGERGDEDGWSCGCGWAVAPG